MTAPTQINGAFGDAYFTPTGAGSATALAVDKWQAKLECDLADVTTKQDGGFKRYLPTLRGGEVTLSMPYDNTIDPGLLYDGATGSVNLYEEVGTSGPSLSGAIVVKSIDLTSDVKDAVRYSVVCNFNGSYAYPTQSSS